MSGSPLLTTLEAARILSLHPDTLRAWRKQKRAPVFVRVGNRYRYSEEALDEFLKNSKEAA